MANKTSMMVTKFIEAVFPIQMRLFENGRIHIGWSLLWVYPASLTQCQRHLLLNSVRYTTAPHIGFNELFVRAGMVFVDVHHDRISAKRPMA